jgi:hypothetical protein
MEATAEMISVHLSATPAFRAWGAGPGRAVAYVPACGDRQVPGGPGWAGGPPDAGDADTGPRPQERGGGAMADDPGAILELVSHATDGNPPVETLKRSGGGDEPGPFVLQMSHLKNARGGRGPGPHGLAATAFPPLFRATRRTEMPQ